MITFTLSTAWLYAAVAIGAGVGTLVAWALIWRVYVDTDSARHNYMARELMGLRMRHDDWERHDDPLPPTGRVARITTALLDRVYRRGRA